MGICLHPSPIPGLLDQKPLVRCISDQTIISNTFCPIEFCRAPRLLRTYRDMSKEARIIKLKVFPVVINAHLHQIIKGKSDTL